ncbi:carbohydrate kinase family protein [Lacticaseibacillus nasuensis]|uniref:carbohydrate kinase family protein n=1 Tax=Lacticaseibacillus nasuensis TaxID=944671 RepID=UPI0022458D93|nr:PfkB family carbohydrate kinase [Lacticaseibacillus nasuensis]MCX2456028.1 PfkB family carbohydrate kinase [Lacticaseibacillus nasuensis]
MDYFIGSTSVIDNVHFVGQPDRLGLAGGAGIYALCGARLWANQVNLACGIGRDYREHFGEWYRQNELSTKYLVPIDDWTPVTDVFYQSEGVRTEVPKFGSEHYHQFEFKEEVFFQLAQRDCGIYVFRNTDPTFWRHYLTHDGMKAKVLWEIAADSCNPESLPEIKAIAEKISVLSLNLSEAKQIFDLQDEAAIKQQLRALNIPLVFLRLGKRGQIFLTSQTEEFVPSIRSQSVVDVTGGGNSSSGATLVGYCEQRPLRQIGQMANLAAIMCLSQYGVPARIDDFKLRINQDLTLK